MDPNAALAALRADIASYNLGLDGVDVELIISHFYALDEWLTKGGFLPDAWDTDRARHGFAPQQSGWHPSRPDFCAAPDDDDPTDLCGLPRRSHSY